MHMGAICGAWRHRSCALPLLAGIHLRGSVRRRLLEAESTEVVVSRRAARPEPLLIGADVAALAASSARGRARRPTALLGVRQTTREHLPWTTREITERL